MRAKKPMITGPAPQDSKEAEARAWLFDTYVGLVGSLNAFGEHANAISQIVLSLEGPVSLWCRGEHLEGEAFLIPAGFTHRFEMNESRVFLLYLDPRHAIARACWFHQQTLQRLPPVAASRKQDLFKLSTASCDEAETKDIFSAFLESLCEVIPAAPALDWRIGKALIQMLAAMPEESSLQQLAQEVGLSVERFRHLFREQLGMPFTRYRLWLRLGAAFAALFSGSTITEAAYHAYFSDSAHFAKTFRQMFGDSISGRFLREDGSRFIQGISYRTH